MPVTGSSLLSIQVSLSGFSVNSSLWLGPERIFTTPELQRRYDRIDISLLTPKCTLVPESFFSETATRSILEGVCALRESDVVSWVKVPQFSSVLVYSNSIDESLSRAIAGTVLLTSGEQAPVLPEMYYLLGAIGICEDYNKIICSYMDGWLHMVIAQGRSLQIANVYKAQDFTTAEYFIFLALKRLQMNPELSTVCFRTPLDAEAEMSLYRYFKSVVRL